jgi:hypothetical protein
MGIQSEDGFSVIAILCVLAIGAGKNQRSAMTVSSVVRSLQRKTPPPIRESSPGREAAKGVGLSTGAGPLAASPPGKKTGRASRGTWTTRCPGHPEEATSADQVADALERRVATDREEERVGGRATKQCPVRMPEPKGGAILKLPEPRNLLAAIRVSPSRVPGTSVEAPCD